MTAEIAVMNKSAIALAADSAATVETASGQKIYNSVNKLFALSKHHPVGLMIFGGAEINGVPWESLIKVYRCKLGRRSFPTIAAQASDFIHFIEKSYNGMLKAGENDFLERAVFEYLADTRDELLTLLDAKQGPDRKLNTTDAQATLLQHLRENSKKFRGSEVLPAFRGYNARSLISRHRDLISSAIDTVFQDFPITSIHRREIYRVFTLLITRSWFRDNQHTGLVVAGFGKDQHYPSLVLYRLDGMVDGRLRYAESERTHITNDNRVSIMPFAQSEMVNTFMEGISPDTKSLVNGYLTRILSKLPQALLDELKEAGYKLNAKRSKKLVDAHQKIIEEFGAVLDEHCRNNHIEPVVQTTALSPKDELAAMAEALVNLTSFRRRVTMEAETVGGPIDVAVISKGDGFVWIKRKHYFSRDLNPDFFEKNHIQICR